MRIGPQQGAVAHQVDAPRHAAGQGVDAPQGAGIEGVGTGQPGHRQPVGQVGQRLGRGQRLQVVAGDHPLRQLLHARRGQLAAQLGLADQDDLQQLAFMRLQVGEQAQLLQHIGRQVLGLVDDQQAVASLGMRGQQVAVERVDPGLGAGAIGCR